MPIHGAPLLTPADRALLKRIAEIRSKVGRFVSPAHRWTGTLARTQRALNAQGSNSIEGHDVTAKDAVRIADGLPPEQANQLDTAALLGYQDAMGTLLELARDDAFSYDVGSLRALHRQLTAPYKAALAELGLLNRPGHQDPRPGLWRRGHVQVGSPAVYLAPDAEAVPGLMAELVEQLNCPAHESAIVCAALAHLNFVGIHPHADGNGRMARMLHTLVLARQGGPGQSDGADLAPEFVSIEEWLGNNVGPYFEALGKAQGRRGATAGSWQPETGDVRAWVRFVLRAHLTQTRDVLERAQKARRTGERIGELASAAGLPERATMALFEAAEGRLITNATYRAQLSADEIVSAQTAAGDLRRMTDLGLLVMHGDRRTASYAAGTRLLAALED